MPAFTRMVRAVVLALTTLGLTGTALAAAPAHAADSSPSTSVSERRTLSVKQRIDHRVRSASGIALNQRGDAYAWGGVGPDRFDCSGLIYYSYRRAGFAVPRTSGAQAGHVRRIAKDDMRAGDLMFFTGSGGVYHAAIFLRWERGHAVMVHAPGSGRRVQVAVPWTSSWFGGTLRRR